LIIKYCFLILFFAYCIVEYVKGVSKNEGCKRTSCFSFLEALVPVNKVLIRCPFCKIFITAFPLKIKVFSTVTIVFFTNSLHTYLNYNNIFHNVRYKKLLRGICWALISLLLDWSFDHLTSLKDIWFICQVSSLRAKAVITVNLFKKVSGWSKGKKYILVNPEEKAE